MSPTFIRSLLLCCLAQLSLANAATPTPATPQTHPVAGQWRWSVPGKQCEETLHYLADGKRLGQSKEEKTTANYEVAALPSLLGFYRLQETIVQSNGLQDCSGDVHAASDAPTLRFIQFSPRHDQFIVCKEENLKACYGPLNRVHD